MRNVVIYGLLLFALVFSRPTIRTLRNHAEFNKLINHHKENTGLPVIIDYFSESCGPCRMIAPHFKNIAKEYKDRAVFAKVDVNANRETSGRQRISSMPTFQFFIDGKVAHQFSGADVNQLRQFTEQYARDFERNNVKITYDDLKAFYDKFAPEKSDDDNLKKVMEKAGGEKGGAGHRKLAEALRKKYKAHPKLSKRYNPTGEEEPEQKTSNHKENEAKSGGIRSLKEVSTSQLVAEIKARDASELQDLVECAEREEEDDDDEVIFAEFEDSGFAERVVIIGSGPGGLSAAIYAGRAGLHPVIVSPREGGQLQGKGVLVENFPGVDERTGPEVVFEMMKQASKFGASFAYGWVTEVDLSNEMKMIKYKSETGEEKEIRSQSVIVATGSDAKWLEIDGEEELKGAGLSACATCDGILFADKEVAVVGGGDSALEEALYLAQTSSKVYILHRGERFRASKILQQRTFENEKIEVIFNSRVKGFVSEERLVTSHLNEDLSVEDLEKQEHEESKREDKDLPQKKRVLSAVKIERDGKESELEVEGLFVAIGHSPNTGFLEGQVDLDGTGYIALKGQFSTKTSREGVFAAGDVADPKFRQAVTSAGTGAMAALEVEKYLVLKGLKDEKQEADREFLKELLEDFGVAKQ